MGEVCAFGGFDDPAARGSATVAAAAGSAVATAAAAAMDFLFLELARLRFFFWLPSVSAGVAATGVFVSSIAAEQRLER